MSDSPSTAAVQKRCPRALRLCGWLLVGLLMAGTTAWAALAVSFSSLSGAPPRYVLAALLVAACAGILLFVRPRAYRFGSVALILAAVLVWYFSLAPSNNRDWAPDVARTATAVIDGSRITIRNLRNFEYRTETDFTPVWEDRTYDLDQLRAVDFMLVYWGSPAIGHVMLSFGFENGEQLAVSIEARKERTEPYSALQGFFRQYELYYVFADERDVVRVRTNYRKEDVYLYRTKASPRQARACLLSYLQDANTLHDKPEWYNALTTNCATSVLSHIRAGGGKGELSWEILLSGYAARVAYRNGNLDDSLPFEELRVRSHINPAALAAPNDSTFSAAIRAGLPRPAQRADPQAAP